MYLDKVLDGLPREKYIDMIVHTLKGNESLVTWYRNILLSRAGEIDGCPKGKLCNRKTTNKSNSIQKYAKDCYILQMFTEGDASEIDSVFSRSVNSTSDNLQNDTICENNPVNQVDINSTLQLLIERVNGLDNIIKSKDGIEKKLRAKIDELENVIDDNKRQFELLKAEITPKVVKFESEIKTMSWLASDVGEFNFMAHSSKMKEIQSEIKQNRIAITSLQKTLRKGQPVLNPKILVNKQPSTIGTSEHMSTPMRPVNTNKSTVSNMSIDSMITTEIDRMMYQIDPQQSDPIIPGAYDSVDFLEHCGKRPTKIVETDNNAGSITPICAKEIATDSNLKCDSYRDKLLGGINKNADNVATNLAKAIKPAFQIPVRINGVQNDPKPENDNFTGVSRKRTSRFYITNIDPSSSKEGLLSYAKQRGVNITHVILFKPRKGRISGRINVTMESKPLLQNSEFWPNNIICRPCDLECTRYHVINSLSNRTFRYTNCDIAVLSEHKLFNHSLKFLNTLDTNYHSIGIADTNINIETCKCGKGGVAIMYKKTLKFNIKPINCPVSERLLGIEIQCNENYSIFVFSVYLPADSNMQNYKYELNIVEDYVNNYAKFGPVIVAGDFNTSCRVTDLERTNVNKSIIFSDFILRNNIVPINASSLCDPSSFTFIPTRTVLDYFLVSEELANDVTFCENIPEGTLSLTSDHLPVFLQLSIPCVANSSNGGNTVWPSWRKASDSSLHAYNELTNEIAVDLLDMPLSTFLDLDTLASKLTDKLKECANITIPSGSFNPNTKPYWSDQVKQAHKAERLARRTWINHGRPRGKSFPSYVEYKSAKNEFRNRQRFAYNAYMDNTYREIDEAAECDVRLFWRLISRRKCRKTNQISEILHDNRQCKSPEDISNAFADFYAGVYTPSENAKFDSDFKAYVTEFVDRTLESCAKYNGLLPGGEINIVEIETAIRNLKLQKAPGYDKLQNEHVRYSGSKLQTVILRIFNAVIRLGRIPLCWKHGLLIPLYKGTFPTKFQWKNIVSSAVNPIERLQKEERMRRDNDFVKFLRLSENNNYDFLWQYAKISGRLLTAKHIAKLWTTPPTSGNCKLCGHFVLDILNHQICMCTELQSQRLSLYNRLTELTSFNFMYTTVSKSDESFSDLLLGNHEDLCDILIPEHRLEVLNEGFSFLKYCRL
ncbi:unnamed protein product [Mytilus edulis]|uniref:Endonuclease/exonuclease/phosphatase domain-containing protein n=1 Tax=Mytilus edulis TaxID=6550 RepID=A0A8S3R0L8_MYTED|nr:unnamed protein product [Mytilus edulis]